MTLPCLSESVRVHVTLPSPSHTSPARHASLQVTGSGESLIQPLLDNQFERQHQEGAAKPPPLSVDLSVDDTVDLVKDAFTTAGERDIRTGDVCEICLITQDGAKIVEHPLNID